MQEIENKKIELAITILEENINKQKSIDTEFKKILIKTIKSNKNIITVIANKIKIDTKFYQLFISFNIFFAMIDNFSNVSKGKT